MKPQFRIEGGGGVMTEQKEPPRPHGDPLEREIVESNPAQRQSDATDDAVAQGPGTEEPTAGVRSTANGIPASDEEEGKRRRKLYEGGADLVSKID
jgi:hypothetical protein